MRIALPPTIDPGAFAGLDPSTPVHALQGETMGTFWRVLFADRRNDSRELERRIVARLAELVDALSHWVPGSALSRFNAAAPGVWMPLPPDLGCVIDTALRIATASDGAFDPAVGAVVDLHGFGPRGPHAAPTDAEVSAARARSGFRRLDHDPTGRRLRQPGGLHLDLSGIAKGYAVDVLAALLGEAGVASMLVEIGGELAGRGVRPDGEPWWVDLEVPAGAPAAPLRVALHGLAVATSGNYVRGDHSIDPRTGRPSRSGVIACSVVAGSAVEADGWATALTIAGVEHGLALADDLGIAARLVTARGEHLSRRLRTMLPDEGPSHD